MIDREPKTDTERSLLQQAKEHYVCAVTGWLPGSAQAQQQVNAVHSYNYELGYRDGYAAAVALYGPREPVPAMFWLGAEGES